MIGIEEIHQRKNFILVELLGNPHCDAFSNSHSYNNLNSTLHRWPPCGGSYEGELRRIVFVKVKSGKSTLSRREKIVRNAIREKRVEWEILKV